MYFRLITIKNTVAILTQNNYHGWIGYLDLKLYLEAIGYLD